MICILDRCGKGYKNPHVKFALASAALALEYFMFLTAPLLGNQTKKTIYFLGFLLNFQSVQDVGKPFAQNK